MKFKKCMAALLTGVMVMGTAVTAMAATVTVKNDAWWDAWTPGYEVADGATLTFNVTESAAGDYVYSSLNAVFCNVETDGSTAPSADNYDGYAEYVVLRSDNFGWGTLYDAGVTYTGSDYLYVDDSTDYKSLLTGATYAITIKRSGGSIAYDYVITESDGTVLNCGYSVTGFGSDDVYVFFTGDAGVTLKVSDSSGSSSSESSSASDTASDTASESESATTETTGDAAPVMAAVVAVAGCAAIVFASRKRFVR